MAFPDFNRTAGSFALGGNVSDSYVYFEDFFGGGYGTTTGPTFASSINVADYLYTVLGGGTPTFIISDAERGGVVACSVGANTDNQGFECQLNGEGWAVHDTKDIYFEARFKSQNAVIKFDFVFGLGTTETSFMAAPAANFIGFTSGATATGAVLDGQTANIIARTLDDQTAWTGTQSSQDTGVDLTADTFVTVAFWLQGNDRLTFYVNRARVFETVSNIPDVGDALTLMFGVQNSTASDAVIGIMEIDYILCGSVR